MRFQQATRKDVESILQINAQFLKTNLVKLDNGFLLGARSLDHVINRLDKYFVALDDVKNTVLGYVEVDYEIGEENFLNGEWSSVEIKNIVKEAINNNNFVYVIQIAVKEQKKGVGRFIVDSLHSHFKDRVLISFVAYKPVFNEVSLNFHLKAGFKRAGTFVMEKKFGITSYERICLVKLAH